MAKYLVTGGSGFVGQRLVEMLVERGAEKVVSFDISPPPKGALQSSKIEYVQGDITKYEHVLKAAFDCDCVYHIAALVGPYHPTEAYEKVNVDGCKNVLDACKELGIKKIVMSSSPSTRFPFPDPSVKGLSEDQLFKINGGDFAPQFLQPYAETKARGEKLIRSACRISDGNNCNEKNVNKKDQGFDLLTVAVAPHQVYGPRDSLFLPSLLDVAGKGLLRIFGDGNNLISFTHVDNYCVGLMCGEKALFPGSAALGKYYVVTDEEPQKFWHVLNQAVLAMGFPDLFKKFFLPASLMLFIAGIVVFLGNLFASVTGIPKHKVNYYMKLNPFAVKMLVIDRYFDISAAKRDLKYEPVIKFEDGWKQTIEWFKENWLPLHSSQIKKTSGGDLNIKKTN